jgi:hypothetical protein
LHGAPVGGLSEFGGWIDARAISVAARQGSCTGTWRTVPDVRGRLDDTAENFLERHGLIVVIADVH